MQGLRFWTFKLAKVGLEVIGLYHSILNTEHI